MKSRRVFIFLPALVLIALLGFGATGTLAYAGISTDDWGISPIASGKISPGDRNGVTGSVNLGATQDVTGAGPLISKVKLKQIKETSATVEWNTEDHVSDSRVEYGTPQADESVDFMIFASADEAMVVDHAVALADLAPGTQYFLQVKSTDEDGNTTVDDNK